MASIFSTKKLPISLAKTSLSLYLFGIHGQKHLCVWKKKQPLPLQLLRRYGWFWPGSKRKAYSFSKEVTASMCTRKFEVFPTLETAGGYEILRTGERGNRHLMVLSLPPGGYTVLYLKATTASLRGIKGPFRRTKCLHLHQNRSKCRWVFFFLLPTLAMTSIPFAGPSVLNKLW